MSPCSFWQYSPIPQVLLSVHVTPVLISYATTFLYTGTLNWAIWCVGGVITGISNSIIICIFLIHAAQSARPTISIAQAGISHTACSAGSVIQAIWCFTAVVHLFKNPSLSKSCEEAGPAIMSKTKANAQIIDSIFIFCLLFWCDLDIHALWAWMFAVVYFKFSKS